MKQAAEDTCRDVYKETRQYYERIAPELGDRALRFRILYGPPIIGAPTLFIGYQPGGSSEDAREGMKNGEHQGWPTKCDYAVAPWPLAVRLREVLGGDQLARCTGLNAVFFRAPDIDAWRRVPSRLRAEMEEFSLHRAERIVRALKPRHIVIIGLGTLDRLVGKAGSAASLRGEKGVLAREGMLWGCPAIGVVHLSGARIGREDRSNLAAFLRDKTLN